MCRLAAYLGAPLPLADLIIKPAHSLLHQSQDAQEAKIAVNGDGVGFAWYDSLPEPGLYKDARPAWSDANLINLCTHLQSRLFLAHVRASTQGEVVQANCHPFVHGRWSFMHNGQTGGFDQLRRPLESLLSDALYGLRRGTTDSELIFLLLLQAGLERDPDRAFSQVLDWLYTAIKTAEVKPFVRLTCVLSDGERLFGFRHASDGKCPSLYVSMGFAAGGLVLASEPLDGATAGWQEVALDRVVAFKV